MPLLHVQAFTPVPVMSAAIHVPQPRFKNAPIFCRADRRRPPNVAARVLHRSARYTEFRRSAPAARGQPLFLLRSPGRVEVEPMSASTDLVALSLLPLWWRRTIGDRLRAGHAPGQLLEALVAERRHPSDLTLPRLRQRAQTTLERAAAAGVAAVGWSDPTYPPLLAAITDPPPVLWIRGLVAAFEPPAVAIVGSRAGSPYALAVAERLGADLTARGVVVVSGLARGVDSAAHRGALSRAARRSRCSARAPT